MGPNKFLWWASFGLFLGIIAFGTQVVLGALNNTLQLKKPLKLGQVEKISYDRYKIEALGKNWTVYLPKKNLRHKLLLKNKDL